MSSEKSSPPVVLTAVLAALLLTALSIAPADGAGDPYREASLDLARRLVLAFPPADGYVVSVQDSEVYLDLAEDQLMRAGMELLVFREGAEIVHPVSKEVLGRYEEKLGYVALTEVQEKYSVGTITEGAAEIRAGDRVRISARPLRVLLLFRSESPALDAGRLARELADALKESQRFRLRDEPEWLPRLREIDADVESLLEDPLLMKQLGDHVRADLILVVDPVGGGESVLAHEVRSLWTGRTLSDYRQPWSIAEVPEGAAPFPSSPFLYEQSAPREYSSKDLPSSAVLILTGDIRGEGVLDVLVSDGTDLTLYSWESGGLIWKGEREGGRGRHVLALEAADLDGDGKTEVLVTAVRHGRLETEVTAWEAGEWHTLGEAEGLYIRAFESSEGEPLLLGQRGGINTVFAGGVREFLWEEGTFRPAGGLTLPSGVNIFGLAVEDLGNDGSTEFISLNRDGRILVYSMDGDVLHRSSERYGGYPERISPSDLFGPQQTEGGVTQGFFTEGSPDDVIMDAADDIRTAFQGRLLPVREGTTEIAGLVVPRNLSGVGSILPGMRQFSKGEVVLLKWEEGRFVEVLRSRSQEGYVADAAVADLDDDGRPEVIMAVNRPAGPLLRTKGSLVVWKYHLQGIGSGEE
jgi:hypothetical protein